MSTPLHETAVVILLRPRPAGFEIFVLRRAPSEAYAFPGGAVHSGEDGRIAAARVVFEDCGVLLARDAGQAETVEMLSLASLRKKIRGGANATEVIRSVGLAWSSEAVMPWSHWISPSIAPRSPVTTSLAPLGGEAVRYSTRIFVAEVPPGMLPTFDKSETVEHMWIRASDASSRASELQLSPALVRTCWELERFDSVAEIFTAARKRAEEPHPILPRLAPAAGTMCLLLPWDPEYETAGQGESLPFAYQPKWALGASRFVLEDRTWKHVAAPGSTNKG